MPRRLLIIASLVLVGCGGDSGSEGHRPAPREAVPPPPPLEHTVLKREGNAPYFRKFTVLIPETYDEARLRQLAMRVTRGARDDYERLQVAFYLPDNNLEGIAWAVANFDPNLSVSINGVSEEESRELVEAAKRTLADGTLVGRWRDPDPMMGGIITITEKSGKLHLHRRFHYDGTELAKELAEVPWQGEGRRLQWADNPGTRDYYVLHTDGRLDIYVAHKRESTLRPIEN